jgi:hypothetical protein
MLLLYAPAYSQPFNIDYSSLLNTLKRSREMCVRWTPGGTITCGLKPERGWSSIWAGTRSTPLDDEFHCTFPLYLSIRNSSAAVRLKSEIFANSESSPQ